MLPVTVSDSDTYVIEEKDTLEGRPEGVYLRKEETEQHCSAHAYYKEEVENILTGN